MAPMLRVVTGFTEEEASRVRLVARQAIDEARARSWPFLSDVLEPAMRRVDEQDRGVLAAVVHALAKYDRLLSFACEGREAEARADVRLEMLLALSRVGSSEGAKLDARLARLERPAERLGVTFSFPDWLVELVARDVGEDALEGALARMNEPAPRVARVNGLRTTRDACVKALADSGVPSRPARHAPQALVIEGTRSPFRTPAFARGDFELQDEASQMVSELVAPPPRSFIVDACAGAGGKTLALAASLAGKGRVVALDKSESKLEELRRRARRAGASDVQAVAVDLLNPGEALRDLTGRAARVLVDVPCSGLGAIRRNPEVRWRLRPEQLESLGRVQADLLRAASTLVAPRGRLIYATCSFLRREGEEVLERFVMETPAFSLVTARDVLGRARSEAIATRDGRYLRTWRMDGAPDGGDDGMDGFFAGVARLAGSAGADAVPP
jgi:16S rRNA (cytosine967-C5)-methyltransferase